MIEIKNIAVLGLGGHFSLSGCNFGMQFMKKLMTRIVSRCTILEITKRCA